MKASAVSKERSRQEISLIFPWRELPKAACPRVIPIIVAALAFAMLLAFVRIKVASPQFNIMSKASWIQLPATGDGVLWARWAKEAGPFLSRYEPSSWDAYPTMAAAVMQATRIPTRVYVPALRDLPPQTLDEPLELASKGEPVFPRRAPPLAPHPATTEYRLVPVLYPLSPLGSAELPLALPPWPGEVDAATAATDCRFLLRLHPAGAVADCVSLTKTTGPGVVMLENWLRRVAFDPKLAANGGWLAIGIQFNNQPLHGTDSR